MAVVLVVFVLPWRGSKREPFNIEALPKDFAGKGVDPDWQNSCCVLSILGTPEVSTYIHGQAKSSPIARKVVKFQEKGSVKEWITTGTAIGRAMNIRSTTMRRLQFQLPVGRVIATAFASFAVRGQPVIDVKQGPDGCVITAYIFQDMYTFGATFTVTIRRIGARATAVEAIASTPGQVYDYGKGKRAIAKLFAHIEDQFLERPGALPAI